MVSSKQLEELINLINLVGIDGARAALIKSRKISDSKLRKFVNELLSTTSNSQRVPEKLTRAKLVDILIATFQL